jgi:hypothetical protein
MARINFSLGTYESAILWRFFDCISSAVSRRMLNGSPPGEENLTFLLCELLDESATALHVLDYPLSKAKKDLAKSDSGITVDVEFETHEHTKHFESKYSGADLGIVLSINHPQLGQSKRASLIQAKRLFANSKSKEFSLYSQYSSYDKEQANFLKELEKRFGVYNSIFYLFYNPPSSGFSDNEAAHIKAYEANSGSFSSYYGKMHPFIDDLIDEGLLPFLYGHRQMNPMNEDEENKAREWRKSQPALRFSDIDTVLSVANNHSLPSLKPFYDILGKRRRSISFAPFADFFLMALASSRYGSSNEEWVKLAEGKKVSLPPLPSTQKDSTLDISNMQNPPTPRHTIKVSVRGTLPNVG